MPENAKVINLKSSYYGQSLKVLGRERGFIFLECPTTHRQMRFFTWEVES